MAGKQRFKAIVPGNHGRMIFAGPRSGEQQKNAASPKGSGVLFDRDT
jgi:hypothetical protein